MLYLYGFKLSKLEIKMFVISLHGFVFHFGFPQNPGYFSNRMWISAQGVLVEVSRVNFCAGQYFLEYVKKNQF